VQGRARRARRAGARVCAHWIRNSAAGGSSPSRAGARVLVSKFTALRASTLAGFDQLQHALGDCDVLLAEG
jgi:hypothetical protein